jgi:hypothetical protein
LTAGGQKRFHPNFISMIPHVPGDFPNFLDQCLDPGLAGVAAFEQCEVLLLNFFHRMLTLPTRKLYHPMVFCSSSAFLSPYHEVVERWVGQALMSVGQAWRLQIIMVVSSGMIWFLVNQHFSLVTAVVQQARAEGVEQRRMCCGTSSGLGNVGIQCDIGTTRFAYFFQSRSDWRHVL